MNITSIMNIVNNIMPLISALISFAVTLIVSWISIRKEYRNKLDFEKRERKKEYYREFIDALTARMLYIDKDCIEKTEAEMEFYKQCNRMPLYASEEVIKKVQEFILRKEKYDESELMRCIRKDICDGDLKEFKKLDTFKTLHKDAVSYEYENVKKRLAQSNK